jgi:hypothetical protein
VKVTILGSGPAGLMAAHAATKLGHDVNILSATLARSRIFGAMYLHEPIPDITEPEDKLKITVIKSGTREGYAQNVYGRPNAEVSWDKFEPGETVGWDLNKTYNRLWEKYAPKIQPMLITTEILRARIFSQDIIFSSIPAHSICEWDHVFDKQDIWIQHGFGNRRLIRGVDRDDDIMYYNGIPPDGSVNDTIGYDWYRFSQIKGYQSWEYSRPSVSPFAPHLSAYQVSRGFKPTRTDCDCFPNIIRIGRYGKWQRGVLTHHAYEDTYNALLKLQ